MELGEYLSKAFSHMFTSRIYFGSLVMYILIAIIAMIIILLLGVMSIMSVATINGTQLMTSLSTGNLTGLATLLGSMIVGLIIFTVVMMYLKGATLLGSMIVGLIIFTVVMMYLKGFGSSFILQKIKMYEAGKKSEFFDGFGKSFLLGLKMFLGGILLLIAVSIFWVIILLIGLIPVLGPLMIFLASIFTALYMPLAWMILIGSIGREKDFMVSLKNGIIRPFTKPMLLIYSLVFGVLMFVMMIIIVVINFIPVLGQLATIFATPLIAVFALSISYNLSQE